MEEFQAGTGYKEEFRNVAWTHKHDVRKTKAHLELMLVKDIKDNMNNFSHPINHKMLNKKKIGTLLNGASGPVTAGEDKAEIPNAFFASFSTN